ncbi:glycoside hydrolase family 10 protein [Aerosakkonemataceae cyanobacterium BLCC-F154]|uniref:Glycoside hydrolase family 10 protein n=1 Tax=Floridaenema fluviatile BLCC-F154 TaxID=3153640 RepID=A0ABV4Y777_9CYAN
MRKSVAFCLLPSAFCLFSSAALAEGVSLGVVRSGDNATQWMGITNRLNQSGVAYCVVDLQSVQQATDLTGTKVLFLPNVESLSPQQAIALMEWMKKGGRLIVSGPAGNLSAPEVRQMLRGVLGAYWAFPLSEPSTLKPSKTANQQKDSESSLRGVVHGGVVIPTTLSSQTAATWSVKDSPPAVVNTNRTTFFGWRWGVDAVANVQTDLAWLKSALNRYGVKSVSGVSTATVGNCVSPNAVPVAVAPVVQRSRGAEGQRGRGAEGQRGRGVEEQRGRGVEGQRGNTLPTSPPLNLATSVVPSAQSPIPSPQSPIPNPQSRRTGILPVTPNPQSPVPNPQSPIPDPTERVAAAGIRVAPGAEAISPSEAIAMRQELENLIGRVESALLTANAGNNSVRIAEGKGGNTPTTVAATGLTNNQLSATNTLQQAREVVQSLPGLIANRDYGNARSQWLKSRQSLYNLYPLDRLVENSEIRAIWLDRGTIVQAGSEQGLAKVFDRLAQAGINTIFFEVVNAGYSIYPSKVAPEQNPLTKGWDPLEAAVKLAHERGMELHAWVWTFAIGNQRHNTILNQPQDYLGPVLTANPGWANYDRQGNIIPVGQTKPFLDPANPEARRYLLKLFEEIVSRYKVDGLQLDYIRYPFQDPQRGFIYGYGGAARQQFQQLTGVDPINIYPNHPLWQKWTEFRTEQVNSFVAEVAQMLRQKRSDLILSVAVFGYPEAQRIQMLQQHWEVWARRGDVDLVLPMAYAQDTNRFQQLAQPWLTSESLGSTLVLPGILLLNLPDLSAIDQIQLVRDSPNGGYALFAMEHFSNSLLGIFNRTQPTVRRDNKEPFPLRQPFAAAANRLTILQREWNFLLSSNQLLMTQSEREQYNTQSTALLKALNRLAEKPNASNLDAAKKALKLFRFQFSGWMRLHSMRNNYQVQTWNNRLASLERLLNYGERIVLKR